MESNGTSNGSNLEHKPMYIMSEVSANQSNGTYSQTSVYRFSALEGRGWERSGDMCIDMLILNILTSSLWTSGIATVQERLGGFWDL